jgi:hypothetical protein
MNHQIQTFTKLILKSFQVMNVKVDKGFSYSIHPIIEIPHPTLLSFVNSLSWAHDNALNEIFFQCVNNELRSMSYYMTH